MRAQFSSHCRRALSTLRTEHHSILRSKVLSYNTANTVIDPEKTYTLEAGSKWDFFSGRMLVEWRGLPC